MNTEYEINTATEAQTDQSPIVETIGQQDQGNEEDQTGLGSGEENIDSRQQIPPNERTMVQDQQDYRGSNLNFLGPRGTLDQEATGEDV